MTASAPTKSRKPASSKKGTLRPRRYPAAGLLMFRRVVLFALKHLVHIDGPVAFKPIEFADFQLDGIIKPIFADLMRDGSRRVRKVLIGLPRDGAKSEIAAVICLSIMFLKPKYKGQYYVVARDKEQARSVFDKIKTMVLHDPILRRACDCQKDSIIVKETGAKFMVLPGDAKSVQSKHPDVCVIDEYHVHRNADVLNAMVSGMIGNWDQDALLIVLSTAGPQRKGPLWELKKQFEKDPRALVYWVGADDGDDMHDPKVWRKANPMPWISLDALKEAHDTLPPWEFERYHLNRFPSAGVSRAIDVNAWDAMAGLPIIDPRRPSFLGVDASFSRDSTALVLDQVDEDGIHNWVAWIIYPEEPGIPINREYVKSLLLEIVSTNYVERVVCDPNYYVLEMLELANAHGVPVEVYRQTAQLMAKAYDILYSVAESGRGRHGGEPRLREQMLNAGKEPTAYGPRLTKLEDDMKIDAAVACAIATTVAESEYQLGGSSFASTGGVWEIDLNG